MCAEKTAALRKENTQAKRRRVSAFVRFGGDDRRIKQEERNSADGTFEMNQAELRMVSGVSL